MHRRVVIFTLVLSVPLIAVLFLLNAVTQSFLITDECDGHSGKLSNWLHWWYDTPSWNGCHPVPSISNLALTVYLPAVYLAYRFTKRFFTYSRL